MITQKQLGHKIKGLRENFGFTQEFVAQKLGLNRQAIMAMETGKRAVDSVELAHLAELYTISIDTLLDLQKVQNVKPYFKEEVAIKFSKDKLTHLILYILARCGGKPNVGETVLYKLLYFIDFDSFELTGKPVTGMHYKKMQFGPVPSQNEYRSVIETMTARNQLKIIQQDYHGFPQKKYIALTDANQNIFSSDELTLINQVISRLSDMTATKIEKYVHEDIPWKVTEMEHKIDYRLVFERTIPFAQTDREMLWQSAAGRDAIKDLGKMSEEEYNYYQNL